MMSAEESQCVQVSYTPFQHRVYGEHDALCGLPDDIISPHTIFYYFWDISSFHLPVIRKQSVRPSGSYLKMHTVNNYRAIYYNSTLSDLRLKVSLFSPTLSCPRHYLLCVLPPTGNASTAGSIQLLPQLAIS